GDSITFTNPATAKACTASFVATVNVSASAGTGGTVAAGAPAGGTCTGTNCTLDSGASSVTFTASPIANYRFGSWSGATCTGGTPSGSAITFTNPTSAKACIANFVATVAVSASAGTGGTVAAGTPTGGTCSGTNCTLDSGASSVTFTAQAGTNYRFSSWSGSTCTGGTPSGTAITFTNPTSAKACTANFVATVSVSAAAGTGGSVAASGLTGATCSGTSCTLDNGASTVTFTPSATSGYRFNGWSGTTCTGYSQSGNAITFTNPTTAKACTASFVATVVVAGAAGTGGSVSVFSYSGGSCAGTTCTLDSGASSVTFQATPSANYRFSSWSGCSLSTSSQVTITNPTISTTCTANFVATVVIDAVPAPAFGGSVAVTSLSNGTCSGTSCTMDSGSGSVQFTPTPASNFRFAGWSGGTCFGYFSGAGNSIIFSGATASHSCVAEFVATVTVEAAPTPTGSGSVTVDNLSGGTCVGSSCVLDSGSSSVTFWPEPAPGYRFVKWTGASCSGYIAGQDNEIIFIDPTSSHGCRANFEQAVTVQVSSIIGNGSVVVTTMTNATCTNLTCLVSTGAGTVTFTPVPGGPNSPFQKWLGNSCNGTVANDGSMTFTNPTSDHDCQAYFSP
ncbi:MAG TPA: hypothetical protein VMZ53_21620, partial [Kofleriaceae bacterium]|nr:hypothetical protein [Kofleriaceae bacterium]